MENRFSDALSLLYAVRTHVIILYISIFFLVADSLPRGIDASVLLSGLAFGLLVQLAYVYDKSGGSAEDSLNGERVLRFSNPLAVRGWIFASVVSLFAVLSLAFPQLFFLLAFSMIMVIPYVENEFRFKSLPPVKPLINVLSFFIMAVMPPVLINYPLAYSHVGVIFFNAGELMAVVFCLTVFFDIRDMNGDASAGVRTIPVVLGRGRTLALLVFLLSAFSVRNFLSGKILFGLNEAFMALYFSAAFRERGKFYYAAIVLLEAAFIWGALWLR